MFKIPGYYIREYLWGWKMDALFFINYLLFWPVLESAENTAEWGLCWRWVRGCNIGFGLWTETLPPSITAMLIIICVISAVSILKLLED